MPSATKRESTSLVATPRGEARIDLYQPTGKARALLALGHGAGGGVDAPDLIAVKKAALAEKMAVALITQPYRVAGRRSPVPAPQLDEAWLAVLPHLPKLPLFVGGRSSGARVACRTAAAAKARGVIALAFPLHPPGKPTVTRAEELLSGVPTLVVNGDSDPFGVPSPSDGIEVVVIPGARHDLRKDLDTVAKAVVNWVVSIG
jgi:predicted alpha/beta-hydrolase family hydrolase